MITRLFRRMIGKKDQFLFKGYQEGLVQFQAMDAETGIYLHIPFCKTLCPYCPYNKVLYNADQAQKYKTALLQELILYEKYMNSKRISSIYIGGGTPTLLLPELREVLDFIRERYGFAGDIGIEIHPNQANEKLFEELQDLGVNLISLGVQTFNDQILKFLGRNYGSRHIEQVLATVQKYHFKCVDIDLMTNLPGQTLEDIRCDLKKIYAYKIDQLSIYPLILFPMTNLGQQIEQRGFSRFNELQEGRILKLIDKISTEHGYQRSSVWTYGKNPHSRYTSVTRESFVGFGAGATSLFGNYFYLNTFDVDEYIRALKEKRMPINLVSTLSAREQMIFWIFWRCYDGMIDARTFQTRFNKDPEQEFKLLFRLLRMLGITKKQGSQILLTDWGRWAYHYVEKQYSLHYLNHLWEQSMKHPWIDEIKI
ncbi:coproporphyrinogen-III oxidase family protein [Desulforamulus ruminis]|uniref:Heme chaperone HemW n=1 Tax=Desulforamulus ruminis (strain ATCC 23193 / DSM 2154 / NCIMB 8452 / DL) TaxID=696281 RepID=F6DRH3_DESRL|nr:coproporphyrinogen-III oxidase family protein [Desulforamulus ruminis]AEG58727.1 Radical SAM domain protein [Desulforamulus ruminis DSM 2154]